MWTPFGDRIRPVRKPVLSAPEGVLDFVRSRLRFEPDARQIEVLESTAKQGILNCSRQWGKSTVSVAKALHRAYTVPGCLVLVASPGERQSAEWMRKARTMALPLCRSFRLRGDGDNKISLLLPNGSRIVGLPGMDGTVRGFSAVSMLLIDEASRVEDSMYKALRPMLAVSDGDLWLMSTPRGRQGFFYEAWEHGGDEWFRVHGPATECPRIRREFLEKERGVMGALSFRQEYLGEFVDSGTSLFERGLVEAALDDSVAPLGTPYTVVAERVRQLVQDQQLAGQVAVAVDATGVGAPVVDLLRAARLGCEVTAVSITGGERESQTGSVCNVPKRDLIAGVQVLLERGELKISKRLRDSWALVKELLDVRMTSTGGGKVRLGADGGGEHDDLVIALALACWRARRKTNGYGSARLIV